MSAIKTAVKNSRVQVEVPPDWPEGCEVLIERVPAGTTLGMREDDWPTTPEGIIALLEQWDSHEPLEMSPEEEVEWQAVRSAQKELEKAKFPEHGDKLKGLWE